jgi:hypothetical protein
MNNLSRQQAHWLNCVGSASGLHNTSPYAHLGNLTRFPPPTSSCAGSRQEAGHRCLQANCKQPPRLGGHGEVMPRCTCGEPRQTDTWPRTVMQAGAGGPNFCRPKGTIWPLITNNSPQNLAISMEKLAEVSSNWPLPAPTRARLCS